MSDQPTSPKDPGLYRIRFLTQDQLYELYAKRVVQGELYGFVTIEEIVFERGSSIVVDPAEEKLRKEFEGVRRTMVPMHAVVRIDHVEKRGTAKILAIGDRTTAFPGSPFAGKGPRDRTTEP